MHRRTPPTAARSPATEFRDRTARVWQPIVGVFLAVVALHVVGAFTAADRWAIGTLSAWTGSPDRAVAPLLVAIDEPTLQDLGPMPWPPATWRRIRRDLAAAGLDEVVLVDPWTTVLTDAQGPPGAEGATVLVPRRIADNPVAPGLPQVLDPPAAGPLQAWEHQLSLPPDDDGVIRDLTAEASAGGLFGPSAFCAWVGRCPSGGPLSQVLLPPQQAAGLPGVSLFDILAGTRLPDAAGRTVLLGITAPWRSERARFGPDATLVTWPEAVGYAIATARSHAPIPHPGAVGEVLLLLGTLILSLLITRLERIAGSGGLLVLPPLVVAALGALGVLGRVIVPPWSAMIAVALVPPLVVALASRRLARRFLDSVALLLLQDGHRYAWRDTRLRTADEIADRLEALLETRFPDVRSSYLHRTRGDRLQLVQAADALREDRLALDEDALVRSTAQEGGARADELRRDEGPARAVPIRQGRSLVGYWIVAWDAAATAPDPVMLAELARWVGTHLALYDVQRPRHVKDRLQDRLETDTATVRSLFATASEERRRQVQALHALHLPLLTADLAGTVQFANRSMHAILDEQDLATVPTLQATVRNLAPGSETEAGLHRLFLTGAPLSISWHDDAGSWRGTAQPVVRETGDGEGTVLGYVLHAQDRTQAEELEAIRGSVVEFASTRVRNALMVIMGYARLLEAQAEDARAEKMLQTIARNADDVTAAMDELKNLAGLENQPGRRIEVDIVRLVREAVHEARRVGQDRGLTFAVDAPEVALPVLAAPGRTRDALDVLLAEACIAAAGRSVVQVGLEERTDVTACALKWHGPGLDPTVLEATTEPDWHTDLSALPRDLVPYARARAVLEDLEVDSVPGVDVRLRFTLPRAGRT